MKDAAQSLDPKRMAFFKPGVKTRVGFGAAGCHLTQKPVPADKSRDKTGLGLIIVDIHLHVDRARHPARGRQGPVIGQSEIATG